MTFHAIITKPVYTVDIHKDINRTHTINHVKIVHKQAFINKIVHPDSIEKFHI